MPPDDPLGETEYLEITMLQNKDFDLFHKWTVALYVAFFGALVLTVSYVIVEIIT